MTAAAKVVRKTPQLSPQRKRMGLRKNEIVRLGKWRDEFGVLWPEGTRPLVALAEAMMRMSRKPVDATRLIEVAEAAFMPVTVELAAEAISLAETMLAAHCPPMTDQAAGEFVHLLVDERRECAIRTMRAVNETAEDRKNYVKGRRRGRDKEYQRQARKEKGATPREESITARKPWEAFGWSRRTWYVKGKPTPPAEAA